MNCIETVAKKIYRLFIANSYAIAIQQDDGRYITKYLPFDEGVIEAMLASGGSAGCYQQGLRNGNIKWICLDFDCKNKENPEIEDLYEYICENLLVILEKHKINYLTEFSGRRGIHVWIIFDGVISKKLGFQIINKLTDSLKFMDERFGLDKFPATDSYVSNKVGKQVKIPLSKHRGGGQSFFFEGKFEKQELQADFYDRQLKILENYLPNNIEKVCKSLNVALDETYEQRYKKIEVGKDIQLSADDIIVSLSKIEVFRNIFDRLKAGNTMTTDWYVLLGTVGCIDISGGLLKNIFALSPSYDEELTTKNIENNLSRYYPATFGYLWKIYDLPQEDIVCVEETGVDYLQRIYGFNMEDKNEEVKTENDNTLSLENTLEKEKKYILDNDENVVISEWNRIRKMSSYDLNVVFSEWKSICDGSYLKVNYSTPYIFLREENEEKTRRMVSLTTEERILTTHLAIRLAYLLSATMRKAYYFTGVIISYSSVTMVYSFL